ncbi:MAG: UDP-N-acetylglucosamine 1-carboxyvinyltransferase, partial [Atopobium sp.]|nr:UDP-N-acetylglucosamine 1-carboxyvinyltransferase [Atopobium sp.]
MDVIKVVGGRSVTGEVTVEGAKNSALKLMAATIMAPGVTTLTNVPNIADVHVMGKVLKTLGARIEVVGLHELKIDTTDITSWETPYSLVAQMRASTAVLGPLISRFGKAVVAMPGGCNIGARKIDMHILGLEALGVEFKVEHGNIHASAPHGITGETVSLAFASVGATENLMMASVFAKGVTVIDNAAREPEIVDLATMLNKMGANIQGAGSPVIEIHGVTELHPVEHEVVGDRIEAGTFLAIGALTGEPITVHGFEPNHLGLVLKKYEQMGITIETGDRWARASRQQDLKAIDIQTLPFPGFPTDMQAQTMTLLALAKGTCIIT